MKTAILAAAFIGNETSYSFGGGPQQSGQINFRPRSIMSRAGYRVYPVTVKDHKPSRKRARMDNRTSLNREQHLAQMRRSNVLISAFEQLQLAS